ncbi:hypothetical protein [Candidatus Parabeggiatoa sp. HSG14]|uniref:hypothetical protein n=1 Tax=Candidatus Parabeggiatoa sp. HSG14 TaxID=3055593 RepID=UPI0032E47129
MKTITFTIILTFFLSACNMSDMLNTEPVNRLKQQFSSSSNQSLGALFGSIAGGLASTPICKHINNSLLNTFCRGNLVFVTTFIGSAIGSHMDESDKDQVKIALRKNGDGEERHWTNSKTGNKFTIKPLSTSEEGKKICRKYKLQMTREGSNKTEYEKACAGKS